MILEKFFYNKSDFQQKGGVMGNLNKFIEKRTLQKGVILSADKCSICHGPLNVHHDDEDNTKRIDGKVVCDDCYFTKFSNEIEQHPICPGEIHGPRT